MLRAKKHLDPCEDKGCKYNNAKKICCYGLRVSHCFMDVELNLSTKQVVGQIVESWYQDWKGRMTENGEPHSLGFAKEDLKAKLEKVL